MLDMPFFGGKGPLSRQAWHIGKKVNIYNSIGHLCMQVSGVSHVSTLVGAPRLWSRAVWCRGAGGAAPPRVKVQRRKGVCARQRRRPPAVPAGAGEQNLYIAGRITSGFAGFYSANFLS